RRLPIRAGGCDQPPPRRVCRGGCIAAGPVSSMPSSASAGTLLLRSPDARSDGTLFAPITSLRGQERTRCHGPHTETEIAMHHAPRLQERPPRQPLLDPTPYGSGKDDAVTDATENAAITHHAVTINGSTLRYTARAGHLVTTDLYSARPAAKIFYVAFT